MQDAYDYLKTSSLETESNYPYVGVEGACKYNSSLGLIKDSGFTKVSRNETTIAGVLASVGPLAVGLNSGPLQFYKRGILNPSICNPYHIDHAVLLVGYGTEDETPYWTLKNSWGPEWGENGYFRMIRGTGKCGVNKEVTYPHLA
jgi:cathepsin F